jgi:hypothetical protein
MYSVDTSRKYGTIKSMYKILIPFLAVISVGGCATLAPISREAVEQFHAVGDGYGVVVGIMPADDSETRKICLEGRADPNFQQFCGRLDSFNIVTANVAATSGKSFLKFALAVERTVDVQPKDIVKFRLADVGGFIKMVSRGERSDCKWTGSSPLAMGIPFQAGGIECDGWSYKSILHINWLNR